MSIGRLMNKERKLEIDILSPSSSPRHVTVICDKFVLATGLTSEPNLPCIYGMDWASSSAPPNLHAKDVGTYCRNHLGYQPIPDKCQDKKQELDHVEPPSTKQPLRSVAIYEANKTFFDSVHLVASLHRCIAIRLVCIWISHPPTLSRSIGLSVKALRHHGWQHQVLSSQTSNPLPVTRLPALGS